MHRFYIDPIFAPAFRGGAEITLPEHVSHQVSNVLRLRNEEPIGLFTGDGSEWVAEISLGGNSADRNRLVMARLINRQRPPVEMRVHITLAMALTRPQRYELALAKCTELGAHEFLPVISERVQRSDATLGNNRKSRWDRIVIEASELSGRVRVPKITDPLHLEHALNRLSSTSAKIVFLWELTTEPMLNDLLASFRERETSPFNVAFVLGPVGGFSDAEADLAISAGASVASLGPRILRTETAAIASMAVAAQIFR